MAQIIVNEISQNYTYNIGASSFATVALPITSSWGPGIFDPDTFGRDSNGNPIVSLDDMLEETVWQRFPATRDGLESFISTYRGPTTNYRMAKDYSYQIAVTLITAGYDVLVCRLSPGGKSSGKFTTGIETKTNLISVKAKYPGSFGNTLRVTLNKVPNRDYYNMIVYTEDVSGVRTACENLTFKLVEDDSNDNILHISEIESKFVELTIASTVSNDTVINETEISLTGGQDTPVSTNLNASIFAQGVSIAKQLAVSRYGTDSEYEYIKAFDDIDKALNDTAVSNSMIYREWLYNNAIKVYDLLKDKLSYSPQRIISPGWDDQDISSITGEPYNQRITTISPLHKKLMEVAYYSRCSTAILDVPRSLNPKYVHDESSETPGYAQILARSYSGTPLYATHSALVAPWGSYRYEGTSKYCVAPPSFLMLMWQRATILNQPIQYEWALPTNRKHTLSFGKFDYSVKKKHLDNWQKLDGVGVNALATIPDIGTTLWGNSTLFEVPPATYNALSNLSTRYLMNAVKDLVYRCGIQITFQYNNNQAYSSFYAGVTPLLDTMKNVGAIDDYDVRMSADINGNDHVNANTVIGKIYLVINGVINDVVVDLIALPPGTDLNQFRA